MCSVVVFCNVPSKFDDLAQVGAHTVVPESLRCAGSRRPGPACGPPRAPPCAARAARTPLDPQTPRGPAGGLRRTTLRQRRGHRGVEGTEASYPDRVGHPRQQVGQTSGLPRERQTFRAWATRSSSIRLRRVAFVPDSRSVTTSSMPSLSLPGKTDNPCRRVMMILSHPSPMCPGDTAQPWAGEVGCGWERGRCPTRPGPAGPSAPPATRRPADPSPRHSCWPRPFRSHLIPADVGGCRTGTSR